MAYQAKRNKRFEEDFELVDENGVVQHTLKVSLDADDMVAKINRKYTALVRALSDVQEIKRKEASNEHLSDAVEMLGRAEIDMFEAVFGAEGTEVIQQRPLYGNGEGNYSIHYKLRDSKAGGNQVRE